MYIYVRVLETESYYQTGPDPTAARVKARLEQASGERCLIVPYQEFDMKVVDQLRPRAIAMSGFGGHFEDRKVSWFLGMDEVLHKAVDMPIICFCGSHQVLGFSFNQNLKKTKQWEDPVIRRLRPTEDTPRRASTDPKMKDRFLAEGFYPITQTRSNPLFKGLPKTMMMRCSHSCEVKKLPKDFDPIATSKHCKIEGMRHRDRPLYGVQFHPEMYDGPYLHGKTLLENFAAIVRKHWKPPGA